MKLAVSLGVNGGNMDAPELNKLIENVDIYEILVRGGGAIALISAIVISTTTTLLLVSTPFILNIKLGEEDRPLKGLKTRVKVIGDNERVVTDVIPSDPNSLLRARVLPLLEMW